jgi:hypothetical protein
MRAARAAGKSRAANSVTGCYAQRLAGGAASLPASLGGGQHTQAAHPGILAADPRKPERVFVGDIGAEQEFVSAL